MTGPTTPPPPPSPPQQPWSPDQPATPGGPNVPLLLVVAAAVILVGVFVVSSGGDDPPSIGGVGSNPTVTTTGVLASTTTTRAGVTTTTAAVTTTTAAVTTTTVVVAIECDTPAEQIDPGRPVDSEIEPTGEPYPANATYYCIAIPSGIDRVTIDLVGMIADLDLFVGFGSIESVQGTELDQGDTFDWMSNEFGIVDERVVIDGPQPGVYYIEITSYEHEFSPFTLTVSN